MIDKVHPGGEILAWHQGCDRSDPTDPGGDDHHAFANEANGPDGHKKAG
jgi:hypothetical protein